MKKLHFLRFLKVHQMLLFIKRSVINIRAEWRKTLKMYKQFLKISKVCRQNAAAILNMQINVK